MIMPVKSVPCPCQPWPAGAPAPPAACTVRRVTRHTQCALSWLPGLGLRMSAPAVVHARGPLAAALLTLVLCARPAYARPLTFSNDLPRRTVDGHIIDSHSNTIVQVNGTFFLYGEFHADSPGPEGSSSPLPKLSVYTSTDLDHWVFGGLLHNNTPGLEWQDAMHTREHVADR